MNKKVGELVQSDTFIYEVSDIKNNDEIYNRIIGKTYVENNDIFLEDLVYIKFLHYDFNNDIKVGEIVVNKIIKDRIINILKDLFENKYQINSFVLADNYFEYDGEDSVKVDRKMMLGDNSYSFFYRKIYKTNKLSNHAYGLAVDINPKENPYLPFVDGKSDYTGLTEEELYYLDNRDENIPHVITHNDIVYKLFIKNGFTWGGDWINTKDYQHFEVDYESIKSNI